MKNLIIILFLGIGLTAFSQKDGDITILQKLFQAKLVTESTIIQERDGIKRQLTPYLSKEKATFKKYILTETNSKTAVNSSVYVVSKQEISKEEDLFTINIKQQPVVCFDKEKDSKIKDIEVQQKMIVKVGGQDVNITDPFTKMYEICDGDGGFCIDHWMTWSNAATGEIILVEYLGSDCYTCAGGGGGGVSSGGNAPCDPSAVYPEEAEFNNYIQMETPVSAIEAPASAVGGTSDPVVNHNTWTVAKGTISGWRVDSDCNYSYYHNKFYNLNLNAFEHTYDFISFKTTDGYFVGSNTFITSVYTNKTNVSNVFNNNTSQAVGKSNITGLINHKLNVALRLPRCEPLTLDDTKHVDGSMELTPN